MVLKKSSKAPEKSNEIVLSVSEIIQNFGESSEFDKTIDHIIRTYSGLDMAFNTHISFTVNGSVKIILSDAHEQVLRTFPNFGEFKNVLFFYKTFISIVKEKIDELVSSELANSEDQNTINESIKLMMKINAYTIYASRFFDYFDTSNFSIDEICKIIDIAHEFGPKFISGIIYSNSSDIPCVNVFLKNLKIREEIIQYAEKKFNTVFKDFNEAGSMFDYYYKVNYWKAYNFKPQTAIILISVKNYLENYFIENREFSCHII